MSNLLIYLEVESMKKFILDYKRYSQQRQLLGKMQQFILEEQLDVICDEEDWEYEEVVEFEKEFIQVMSNLHQANSSRKWRSIVKNAKME